MGVQTISNNFNIYLMKQDREEPTLHRESNPLLSVKMNFIKPDSIHNTKLSLIFELLEDDQCSNKSQMMRLKCRSKSQPIEGKLSNLGYEVQAGRCESKSLSSPKNILLSSTLDNMHQLQFGFDQQQPDLPQVKILPLVDEQILKIQSKIRQKQRQAQDYTKNIQQLKKKCTQNPSVLNEQTEQLPYSQQLLRKFHKILEEITELQIQLKHKTDIRQAIEQAQKIQEEKKKALPLEYQAKLEQLEIKYLLEKFRFQCLKRHKIQKINSECQELRSSILQQQQQEISEMTIKKLRNCRNIVQNSNLKIQQQMEKFYSAEEQYQKDLIKIKQQHQNALKKHQAESRKKKKELEQQLEANDKLFYVQVQKRTSQLKQQYHEAQKKLVEKYIQKVKKIKEMLQAKRSTFNTDEVNKLKQKYKQVIEQLRNHESQDQ